MTITVHLPTVHIDDRRTQVHRLLIHFEFPECVNTCLVLSYVQSSITLSSQCYRNKLNNIQWVVHVVTICYISLRYLSASYHEMCHSLEKVYLTVAVPFYLCQQFFNSLGMPGYTKCYIIIQETQYQGLSKIIIYCVSTDHNLFQSKIIMLT